MIVLLTPTEIKDKKRMAFLKELGVKIRVWEHIFEEHWFVIKNKGKI